MFRYRAHLSAAGDLHAVDGSGDLDGADAAVLAALLTDVLQDLFVVLVVHQFLRHHHVEEAEHLCGHARVLQPLKPRDLQRHRGLYDGGLQVAEESYTSAQFKIFTIAADREDHGPDSQPQSHTKCISHESCCFLPPLPLPVTVSLAFLQWINMLEVIFPLTFHSLHLPL